MEKSVKWTEDRKKSLKNGQYTLGINLIGITWNQRSPIDKEIKSLMKNQQYKASLREEKTNRVNEAALEATTESGSWWHLDSIVPKQPRAWTPPNSY